jgi:hypothetical protein
MVICLESNALDIHRWTTSDLDAELLPHLATINRKSILLKSMKFKMCGTWSLRPETPQGSQILAPRIR